MAKKAYILLGLMLATRGLAEPRVSNLIAPAAYFINHKEQLECLAKNLHIYRKTSLKGTSGIGKTQVARMYAQSHQDQYDLIWFIDSSKSLNEEFKDLAKEINKQILSENTDKLSEDLKTTKEAVMKYLTTKKNWLLILDNLKLNQNHRIQDIISWEHNGHIIACSQDANQIPQIINLKAFDNNDSIELIKTIINDPNLDTLMIEPLVKAFKGYPVLTAQGAAFLKDNTAANLEHYKATLISSHNPIISSIELANKSLKPTAKSLLHKIALINNQKFSRSLLSSLVSEANQLDNDLLSLERYGLITGIYIKDKQYFEMHDTIKEIILASKNQKITRVLLEEIITKLNNIVPKGVSSSHSVMASADLRSSMEELLKNAETYQVTVTKVLELRKNLMTHYLNILDYCKCQEMMNWLLAKEQEPTFVSKLVETNDLVNYSWYLSTIGVYEDFAKSNDQSAVRYLNRAAELIKNIKGLPELHFTINAQLAQMRLFGGDIPRGEKDLQVVDDIVTNNPKADLDMGLFWFLKAQLAITQGNYEQALIDIDKNIEAEAHLPRDSFTAPTFVVKASILNALQRYEEAYREASAIYNQEISAIKEPHEMHGRILIHLARATLHLGQKEKALGDIEKTINIYVKHNNLTFDTIGNSTDTELGNALAVQGETLSHMGKSQQAIDSFLLADKIYNNRYGENKRYMDNVAHLYWLAILTCKDTELADRKFYYQMFAKKYEQEFGLDNKRGQDIVSVGQNM